MMHLFRPFSLAVKRVVAPESSIRPLRRRLLLLLLIGAFPSTASAAPVLMNRQ
jgi:hypothetical protein